MSIQSIHQDKRLIVVCFSNKELFAEVQNELLVLYSEEEVASSWSFYHQISAKVTRAIAMSRQCQSISTLIYQAMTLIQQLFVQTIKRNHLTCSLSMRD